MKIAIFSWEALEGMPVGGNALYVSRLAAALSRFGHQVHLFTRLGRGQAMEEAVNGIHVHRCPWDRHRNFVDETANLSDSFYHYFMDSSGSDGPFDVVHCHEWITVKTGLRIVCSLPVRLAISLPSTEWGRTGRWPEQGDSRRIAEIEEKGISRADAIIGLSQWALRSIRDQFHPPDWKCQVAYHGVDADSADDPMKSRSVRFRLNVPDTDRCVLFAGRFSESAGADLAAKASRRLAETMPGIRFVFTGSGPLATAIQAEAGPEAMILPAAERGIAMDLYHMADMVLAPFRRDHTGRAVLPAWAAGKPVLVLRDSVAAEFVKHGTNGWIVEDNPEAIMNQIQVALLDPAVMEWMGQNARTAAATAFTWEATARATLAAYNRKDRLNMVIGKGKETDVVSPA